MLVPHCYGVVDRGIHRSAEPQPQHFPFLQSLRLRTCVMLMPDPSPEYVEWLTSHNIRIVTPHEAHNSEDITAGPTDGSKGLVRPFSSLDGLSQQSVTNILGLLIRAEHHPVLVTCPTGRYRTGVVAGCLRKVQRWSLVIVLEEYRRFADNGGGSGDRGRRVADEEFIETFDTELLEL